MHPADGICSACHHQSVGIVAQPCRYAQAHGWPFVARALGIAFHLYHLSVQTNHSVTELRSAEASACNHFIKHLPFLIFQTCLDVVEISSADRPPFDAGGRELGLQYAGFARLESDLGIVADNLHVLHPRSINCQAECARLVAFIPHLRLHADGCCMGIDISFLEINISTGGLQVGIEGEGLIDFVGYIKPHVLRYSAIVRIEVLVVPLINAVARFLMIGPTVVGPHFQQVLSFLDIRCEVESESHDAILAHADELSVEIDFSCLAHTFKLDEDFLALYVAKLEFLAIPHHRVGQLVDCNLKRIVLIPCTGQSDCLLVVAYCPGSVEVHLPLCLHI